MPAPRRRSLVGRVWRVDDTPAPGGQRGRFPNPRRCSPSDVCYAIVVKERKHGRVINVTTRVVCGPLAQGEAVLQASPVRRASNTYNVECNNLPVCQHARRLGRKVNTFPQCAHKPTVLDGRKPLNIKG